MEYVALGGETPLTELPSVQSMLKRTSIAPDPLSKSGPLRTFLEEQFYRISLLFVPYSLHGDNNVTTETLTWLSKRWGAVLGLALAVTGLIGSISVRPRMLFSTLASFGFFWNVPMRQTTAVEEFESIYYIGLPLVFFTIVLLLAMRLPKRDGVIVAAAFAALALFAASSFQMSRMGHGAESTQKARAVEQDLLAIHEFVAGETINRWQWEFYLLRYYLHQSIFRSRPSSPTDHRFTVIDHRADTDALLTPQNQYLFLYDTAGLMAWYRSLYRSVVATEPMASEEFDVYLIDGTVYYLKEPCYAADFVASFFLHVFPAAVDDLSDDRREYGFDNFDFVVRDRGLLFDGKCLASVELPQYDIAGFRTGRIRGDGAEVWSIARVLQGPKLVSAYPSIVSREPTARSEFDLYIDGGKIYYVKEPCGIDDVQDGFFLHIAPADPDDLPDARREYRFDNLDFRFDVRGVHFDGKCAASVGLPQYAIARITTGQYDGVDRIWEVELAPDALE